MALLRIPGFQDKAIDSKDSRTKLFDFACLINYMAFADDSGKFGDISSHFGMIWRFATMADPLVVEWHSRDLDSLPNPREVAAVNDWLCRSNKTFQVMRDHPLHNSKILGGAFGMRISGSHHSYNQGVARNQIVRGPDR